MEIVYLVLNNPIIIISLIVLLIFYIFPPKNINSWYGYRTEASKKNFSNWKVAQTYSAKLSLIFSVILLVIQVFLYFLYGSNAIVDLSIVFIWVASMVLTIYKVENKLRNMN